MTTRTARRITSSRAWGFVDAVVTVVAVLWLVGSVVFWAAGKSPGWLDVLVAVIVGAYLQDQMSTALAKRLARRN